MNASSISVCVATYNAEEYLDKCLSSVLWCDERVVVDLGSSDRTLEIAASFECRIVKHMWVPVVEMIRDEMVNLCTNDWVLLLDPDEVVPPTLTDMLRQVADENQVDAVSIPWKNYIFGRWMRHSGWSGDRHMRFFRKGAVRYPRDVHSGEKSVGRILQLPEEEPYYLIHLNYDTVSQFVQKLDRYTSAEAEKSSHQSSVASVSTIARAFFSEFGRRFFQRQGYLDGVRGLAACELMGFYATVTALKTAERDGWPEPDGERSFLSHSREACLCGVRSLFLQLENTAERTHLRLTYGVLRRLVALAIRLRAF